LEHTFQIDDLNCSALPKFFLGTMASADFLPFVVTADFSVGKTSRDKPILFPRLPARSTQ
jgi:hypothetical protein